MDELKAKSNDIKNRMARLEAVLLGTAPNTKKRLKIRSEKHNARYVPSLMETPSHICEQLFIPKK